MKVHPREIGDRLPVEEDSGYERYLVLRDQLNRIGWKVGWLLFVTAAHWASFITWMVVRD